MEINKVYLMDCKDLLDNLPKDRKIVIITDPPYGINLNLNWLSEIHLADGKKANKSDDLIKNDEKPIDVSHLFKFKRRLIFGFPYIYDKEATGWVVWDKQPKIAERGIVTPVEVASTTLRTGYDIMRYMWGGFMRDKQVGEIRYEHPTQKPLKLMRRIIEKFTKEDELIVDPYCGSGSTLLACKQLGRDFIGCDIEEKYVEITNKRLSQSNLLEIMGGINSYA